MVKKNNFHEEIRYRLRQCGKTEANLAESLTISAGQLSKKFAREKIFTDSEYLAIIKFLHSKGHINGFDDAIFLLSLAEISKSLFHKCKAK